MAHYIDISSTLREIEQDKQITARHYQLIDDVKENLDAICIEEVNLLIDDLPMLKFRLVKAEYDAQINYIRNCIVISGEGSVEATIELLVDSDKYITLPNGDVVMDFTDIVDNMDITYRMGVYGEIHYAKSLEELFKEEDVIGLILLLVKSVA